MRKKQAGTFRSLPHIADRLFDVPLMMHPRKLRSIVGVLGMEMGMMSHLSDDIVEAAEDNFLTVHSHSALPAGCSLCVIPVHGTLVQRGDSLDSMSGLRSYESIRADLRDALADGDIDAILLDFDSGGGEVAGCFDLVDEIAAADKPVYAFVNEAAYSAAYALASAADRIYMARTAGVGSIGVVAVHVDQSEWDKELGVNYTPIFAGKHKMDGWGHAPLSDDAKAEFQKGVDHSYAIFASTVASNRGISEKSVRDTQAGCFSAEEAMENGLADGVGTFDEIVAMIAEELQEAATQEISGQRGRKAFSGPSGDHSTTKGPSDMKVLKGKTAGAKETAKEEKKVKGAKSGKAEMPDDDEKEECAEDDDETGKEDAADPDAADDEEEKEEPKKAEKPQGKKAVKLTDAVEEAAGLTAEDAAEITDLCVLYGNPSLASGFIRKGASVDAVRAHLLKQRNEAAKAASAAGDVVDNSQTGLAEKSGNSLVENMRKRVGKKK